MSENKEKGPLLYIYQPFSRTPTNKMQDVYTNKREKGYQKEENKARDGTTVGVDQLEEDKIENSGNNKETAPKNNVKHNFSFNRVKSFKEMNITERLEYLVNFPKALPPVPCVFYTKNKNYQGYLKEYNDHVITLKNHDETTEIIPIKELKEVIMIGIKK